MKNSSATIAFIDLLFNLLLGITVMFVIAFLMINPPAQDGQVTPPVMMLIEMTWDDKSKNDMDLWVRGVDNMWIGYSRKNGRYMTLERDDTGVNSDTITINGVDLVVERNYEVVSLTMLPPGEYFVNAFYYSNTGEPEEVTITVTTITPFKQVFVADHILTPGQEVTYVSFVVNDAGEITDIRSDIDMMYVSKQIRNLSPGGR